MTTSPAGADLWIGTSWKMNKTRSEANDYVAALLAADPPPSGVAGFILPPHTVLAEVAGRLVGSAWSVGTQNANWRPEGAGTGEVSMRMVRDAGASIVEIGHSERRAEYGDTDEAVQRKVRAALEESMTPLLCVGESAEVRSGGGQDRFIAEQVASALELVDADRRSEVVIAYEPIWAIGEHGTPAEPEQIAPVVRVIAETVAEQGARILYGGSVTLQNASELLQIPGVGGLFVGRTAWDPAGLLALIDLAAGTR